MMMRAFLTLAMILAVCNPAHAQDQPVTLDGRVLAYGTDFNSNGTGNGMLEYMLDVSYEVLNLHTWWPVSVVGSFGWHGLHDVLAESGPFKEVNYEPAVDVVYGFGGDYLKSISAGFVHQSTGEDSSGSGGWNRVRLSGVFEQRLDQYGITIRLVPLVEWAVSVEPNTDGIADTEHLGLGVDNLLLGGYAEIENSGNIIRVGGYKHQIWAEGAADLIPGLNDMRVFGRLFSGNAETLKQWDVRDIGAGLGVSVTR